MPLALLAAFAGSLTLHLAALFGTDVDLSPVEEPPPLKAELQIPPPAAPTPPPAKPKPPKLAKPALPAVAEPSPAPVAEPARDQAPPAVAEAPPAAEPAPPAPPAPPVQPVLAGDGGLRYTVYRGTLEVGRAIHTWHFADGEFRLTALTETSGLIALFKPVRVELESQGKLAPWGLQPERFTTRRNGQETTENARFDWDSRQLTLQRDGSTYPLAEGTQDLLSFHYQLAFLSALEAGAAMGVATGRKFERYRFDALGEEMLETPAGAFRTLHLRVQTDSTTEVWLALDRQRLPIKIRHTDRKGESFEQIVSELGR